MKADLLFPHILIPPKRILESGLIALALSFGYCAGVAQSPRVWIQTTVEDFSAGRVENDTVTNSSGGEVRLMPFLVKTIPDTRDYSFLPDRVYNSRGEYLQYWIHNVWQDTGSGLLIQRYDSEGNAVGPVLRANDGEGPAAGSVGYMSNGYFYAAWWAGNFNTYGQLFDSNGVKVGTNQIVSVGGIDPVILTEPGDSAFRVFVRKPDYSGGAVADSTIIFYSKVDLHGMLIDTGRRIHPHNLKAFERPLLASASSDSEFILVFAATEAFWGGADDLYLQRLSIAGDQTGEIQELGDVSTLDFALAQIARDEAGRQVIIWSDNRPQAVQPPGSWNLYGQLLDREARKMGRNFSINSIKPGETGTRYACMHYHNGVFSVWWGADSLPVGPVIPYRNEWGFNYDLTGVYTSSVHDAGPLIATYDSLSFMATTPSGTSLKFQLRSGTTPAEFDTAVWRGPDGTAGSYYTVSGEAISTTHHGQRYLQWRAHFSTTLFGESPTLFGLALAYSLSSSPPPEPPALVDASPGHGIVTLQWQHSPSPAIYRYKIYRGMSPGSFDSIWTKTLSDTSLSYQDSEVVNRSTYYYAVTAEDSNYQESDYSAGVSAVPYGITIYVSASALAQGSGTIEQPYPEISRGMNRALRFDTVSVLPGIYHETVRIRPDVFLAGSGPARTSIEGGSDSGVVICRRGSGVSGFTINMISTTSTDCAIWCSNSGPLIEGNVIIKTFSTTIPENAIIATGGTTRILRNYIVGFDGGVIVSEFLSSLEMANNIIVAKLLGSALYNDAGGSIINNTLVIEGYGVAVSLYSYPPATIKNNIIIGPSTAGGQGFSLNDDPAYRRVSVSYNNVSNFHDNYYSWMLDSNNISADPGFVNRGGADFRLQSGSVCGHAGDPDALYNNRDGSRNDMGAFGGPNPIDPAIIPGFAVSFASESVSGFPGDTVLVEVTIDNASRLASAQFSLSYDSSIVRLLSIEKTILTNSMQISMDTSRTGWLGVLMTGDRNIGGGSGALVDLHFRISPSVPEGVPASPVTVESVNLRDSLSQPLLLREVKSGVIAVSPGGRGGRYVFVDWRNSSPIEDGSRRNPWKTAQRGLDHALPGDTVLLAAGTYEEPVQLRDSLELRGNGAGVTSLKLDSIDLVLSKSPVACSNVKGVCISHLTIVSPDPDVLGTVDCRASTVEIHDCRIIGSPDNSEALIAVRNGSAMEVHDTYLSGSTGIAVSNSSLDVTRTVIKSVGGAGGIFLTNSTARITNDRFYITDAYGINVVSGRGITIRNNLIRGATTVTGGILVWAGDSLSITNNTLDTRFTGMDIRSASGNVMNNIITGDGRFGVSIGASGLNSFNDVWGNTVNFSATTPGMGDLSLDPKYVDLNMEDYRLQQTSPCRDAGTPDSLFNDGDGSRSDMGLYGGGFLDTLFFNLHGAWLSMRGSTVAQGDTFILPITGATIRGTASAEVEVSFDSTHLELISASTASGTSMFALSRIEDHAGNLILKLDNEHGFSGDSADIIRLKFVPRKSVSATAVQFRRAKLYNESTAEIPVTRLSNAQVIITSVAEKKPVIPVSFELGQNYPNPFNPVTTISYTVAKAGMVSLDVYNILGQQVAILVSEYQRPHTYSAQWDASKFSSGVYFYRLRASGFLDTKKMILIR
jgi:hypothetical protein